MSSEKDNEFELREIRHVKSKKLMGYEVVKRGVMYAPMGSIPVVDSLKTFEIDQFDNALKYYNEVLKVNG